MTLKLTDNQLFDILRRLNRQEIIDFLVDDIEKSVDCICDFIMSYVDSKTLQDKIINSMPPVQMELFND